MNLLFRLLLGSGLCLLAGCATLPPTQQPIAVTVQPAPLLLVSIDAYRADYIDRGISPTLSLLARSGVQAQWMQPSFPSLTFPNHYTLITGLRPDHHGIVNNTMIDPTLGSFSMSDRKAVSDGRWWAEGTPLWVTADEHGLRTGTMFWPGSEAEIQQHRPDYWESFNKAVSADHRVDTVLAWLDLPAAKRPRFMTLYFDAVDHAGHSYGPDSPEVDAALRDTDAALARLVAGLKQRGLFDRINLIVLADHGMAGVPRANSIVLDNVLPLDKVQLVNKGILAGFNPKDASPTAVRDFAAIEQRLERPQQHMQCWDKTRVPARFHYGSNPRVPQLLCLANIGWRIVTNEYLKTKKGDLHLGDHGYDNADPLMRALFVAHGPAFRVGAKVPAFPNVDVYPLMAHLLDLPAAPNDGDYDEVKGMLRAQAR